MRKWTSIARCAILGVAGLGITAISNSSALGADPLPNDPYMVTGISAPRYLDAGPDATPTVAPAAAPAAPDSLNTGRAPLMSLLDKAGVGRTLDDLHINMRGWIEASYNYNFDNPAGSANIGRVFDFNDNRGQINQFNLIIERKVDPKQWDVGGLAQMFYGTDGRFTTSSDFLGNGGSEYYYDIPQLYVDLNLPIGNGLRLRAGKFLFFKQIDPNASIFFSHSFAFGGAMPFTLTGFTAYYPVNDTLSVEGGISRGWGQTMTDNNGAIDALGRIKYQITDKTIFTLALIFGPEFAGDSSHYTTVVDATLTHQLTDRLTLLFDGVFGYSAEPSAFGSAARWYGISAYGVYKCCDEANFNLRGEVFRDEEGITTEPFASVTSPVSINGVTLPRVGGPFLFGQTLFEVTAGFTLTPFPKSPLGSNLKIRPEVRYDYSTRAYFNGLHDHGQVTVAIDAYFDF